MYSLDIETVLYFRFSGSIFGSINLLSFIVLGLLILNFFPLILKYLCFTSHGNCDKFLSSFCISNRSLRIPINIFLQLGSSLVVCVKIGTNTKNI